MHDSQYLPKMKGLSTVELLDITTQRRDEYEEEALLCAESEIRNRHLTDEELQYAQAELESIAEGRLRKRERIKKLERGVYEAVGVLHPLASRTTLMTIRSISVLLFLSQLWVFSGDFYFFKYLLQIFPRWSFADKIFMLQVFWIPIACFGFFRLKKFGWKMFNLWAVFSTFLATLGFSVKVYLHFVYGSGEEEFYGRSFGYIKDFYPVDDSLQFSTLFIGLMWLSFIVYLNYPNTRKVYAITRKERRWTFIVPMLISVYMWLYECFYYGLFT